MNHHHNLQHQVQQIQHHTLQKNQNLDFCLQINHLQNLQNLQKNQLQHLIQHLQCLVILL